MSKPEIRRLINRFPARLYLRSPIEAIIGSGMQRQLVDEVEKVLELHRESREHELDDLDRLTLRTRLLVAAGRLQELIDSDDENGREPGNEHAQRNLELFGSIAAELGLDPQQLQALSV